jgi:hypothetical protein
LIKKIERTLQDVLFRLEALDDRLEDEVCFHDGLFEDPVAKNPTLKISTMKKKKKKRMTHEKISVGESVVLKSSLDPS